MHLGDFLRYFSVRSVLTSVCAVPNPGFYVYRAPGGICMTVEQEKIFPKRNRAALHGTTLCADEN